jgi:hypothetical protein
MSQASERRKQLRFKKFVPQTLRISIEQRPGYPKVEHSVRLLDTSDKGCRIATTNPLNVGSIVFLDRQYLGARRSEMWSASVTWCSIEQEGGYTAGLQLQSPARATGGSDRSPAAPTSLTDHYEILQVNPKADPETIHRIYRMLAQRYHPDNGDTGNELIFLKILEAYQILSDPEKRAAYDVRFFEESQLRWKIFDQTTAIEGPEAEKAKRSGILLVLYTRRRNEPTQPGMTIHEMEDLLGCPREHLEFSLWYLREKGLLQRGDNGRYQITASGAELAEEAEIPWAGRADRLLPPVPA